MRISWEMMVKPRVPVETLSDSVPLEGDSSGVQAIAEAWDEVFAQMRRSFLARDYGRAVDLGTRFLDVHPAHVAARLFVQECETLFECQLEQRLDPLDRNVSLLLPLAAIQSSLIDAETAYLLAQVDGKTTLEDLIDLLPLSRVAALRLIASAIDADWIIIV